MVGKQHLQGMARFFSDDYFKFTVESEGVSHKWKKLIKLTVF